MLISSVNNYQNKFYSPSFGVNLQSKKLRFKNDDFFVKLRGYGTNSDWAKKIIETADIAVRFMRLDLDFESILRFITGGVKKANQHTLEIKKRLYTGILRTKREHWLYSDETGMLTTPYGGEKSLYKSYKGRFDYTVEHPLKNPFKNFSLTRPYHTLAWGKLLYHPDSEYINNSLDMVSNRYKYLHEMYIKKEASTADLPDINNKIAEIRWILAHTTPWKRGSDAIANTFIRTIYKAMGIKTFPLKRGVSLDLEAYCTNLEEYKKNFPKFFQHEPKIID